MTTSISEGRDTGIDTPFGQAPMVTGSPGTGTVADPWPLTEAQEGLWFAQRLDPSNPLFNTGHYLSLLGALDLPAFRTAVTQVMTEAQALSLRMVDLPDGPRQWLVPDGAPALEVIDLRDHAEPEADAIARMHADMRIPVDPTRDALARHILFVLNDEHHVWYLRVHHLAADGYGMGLIEHRLAQCYAQACGGPASEPLAPLASVIAEDARYRHDDRRARDRAYWLAELADPPPAAELAEGAATSAHTAIRLSERLPVAVTEALHHFCQQHDQSWPDVITTLAAAYLGRHTAQDIAIYGVPFMGRLGSASARVPCTVMNVAPLRLAVDGSLALTEVCDQASRQMRHIRRHGRYRSEQLRRDLGLLGSRRRLYGPLINVLPLDTPAHLHGLNVQRHVLGTGPVDDLTVSFRAGHDAHDLWLELEANPLRYRPGTVAAHLPRLTAFLAAALAAERLDDVPTLAPAETRRWLFDSNDTAHPVPDVSLWQLLHAAMGRHADEVAIASDDATLTYAELDHASHALAQRLAAVGAGPGTRVAVALPRGLSLPVALLAILRCGAAYLPLDLTHPASRIDRLLEASRPVALLGQADTLAPWSQTAPDLPRVSVAATDTPAADASPLIEPAPDDAAYVLYTSGSTGAPKGVVVSHRAIVNRLLWMQAHYGIDAHARILQKTPYTFDVSVWEFFLPLISGAVLVMAPPDAHRDPAWLVRLIREQAITTLHFVPSMLAAFLDETPPADLPVRQVFCSGEALPAALRDRFHTLMTAELHNLYGPTEAAVDVSWWPAGPDDDSQPVPIGFPVWNTALYVLDNALRPVPPGVPGRLYLAGRQLADGYLGQPELTAERFLPNPWPEHGPRMYDTGDLAQWRDDGAVLFLGRRDDQIKLRGQRIEPGEIEAALAQLPAVSQVAVLALNGRDGQPYLAAYVQPAPGQPLDEDTLRAHARAHLPDAMVPSAWVLLDHWPVTVNGKLDRRALPEPAQTASAGRGRAPATPLEQAIATAFAEVLGLDASLSADDDFFELGGHSLLAAQLARRLRDELGAAISIGTLFEQATPSRLAQWIDSDQSRTTDGGSGFGPCIVLRAAESPRPALFCVHPAGGISWSYGGLARALPGPARTVYGLQARLLNPSQPVPDSLQAMAATYVDEIISRQPDGPYHLLGWSVGGIIAHAMACELQARGRRTGVLAMLDAYPSDRWRAQPEPAPDAVYKALLHIAGHDPATLADVPLTRAGVIGFLRQQQHPLAALSDDRLLGVIRSVEQNNRLVRGHHHQRYDGALLYFRAALDHAGQALHPDDWLPYVGALEAHDIPALHAHLTGPDATTLIAPRVAARLQEYDP